MFFLLSNSNSCVLSSLVIFYLEFGWVKYKQYFGIMESNAVLFYEKFPVLYAIMPYYDYTHRCFLLLSELCKGSRDTLTQWYEEFVNAMRPHWQTFFGNGNSKRKFPPWDLFDFDFENWVPLNFNWKLNIKFSGLHYFFKIFFINTAIEKEVYFINFL